MPKSKKSSDLPRLGPRADLAESAQTDLLEIWSYVAENNPPAADKLIKQLLEKFRLLAKNPKLGRGRPDFTIGMRQFPYKKYSIFYFETETGVEIYRVLHSARDIEGLFEEYFEGLKE